MKLKYLSLLLILVFICNSCKKETNPKSNEPNLDAKKELVMAEVSEMANLMNEMYAYNEAIKQQIINGNLEAGYPENFDKIHTAILTDPTDRDLTFESFSRQFIESQKSVFNESEENLKSRYNNSINSCMSCHNVKCVGPIPRIKKLLIN